MRPSFTRLLTVLLGCALTEAATYGKLYTYDTDTTSRSINQIVYNADLVKLIVERRMKPSHSSSLGTVDESAIELIDGLGGSQTYLFGDEGIHRSNQRLLVICECGNTSEGVNIPSKQGNSISFPTISSDLIKDEFIHSLLDPNPGTLATYRVCSTSHGLFGKSTGPTNLRDAQECLSRYNIFNKVVNALNSASVSGSLNILLDSWVSQDGRVGILKVFNDEDAANNALASTLVQYFEDSVASSNTNIDELALLLHPEPFSKARSQSRNQVEERADSAQDHIRRDGVSIPRSRGGFSTNPLSVCHGSNSSCNSNTENCSNHGYCYEKSSNDTVRESCFACKCVPTVIQNSDGTVKKITWGGAACEKKDISSPFFLLAGISVLITIAIGYGIGMLFNIGQEDLPSVISAGVGGSKDSR